MLEELAPRQKLLELIKNNVAIVVIGPITAKTSREAGLEVDVMPEKYLFEEAVIALSQLLERPVAKVHLLCFIFQV
jgi:uroporphyrinogen-III synthase